MFYNMSENEIMDYLVDGVYNNKKLTEEEINYGINLCDEWISCHISDYWRAKDLEKDEFAKEQAEELVYTTTLKLDLLNLLNK